MAEISREQVLEYDKKYNQHPWLTGNVDPIPVEKADGIFFWDYNGKKYYDMSSQLANVNLGYGNKDINEKIIYGFIGGNNDVYNGGLFFIKYG